MSKRNSNNKETQIIEEKLDFLLINPSGGYYRPKLILNVILSQN
jgi:hypothetical protein